LHETVDVIDALIEGLLTDGVTDEEVEVGRGYLVGSMLLGLEDTASRMARIGGSEISRNEVVPLEEHVERIRAIEPADVNRVVRRVLGGPRATVLVGPFDGDESPV
jgi:predicted Zn-dependent peptidase